MHSLESIKRCYGKPKLSRSSLVITKQTRTCIGLQLVQPLEGLRLPKQAKCVVCGSCGSAVYVDYSSRFAEFCVRFELCERGGPYW
jgi:hypothetical protein